MSQEQQYQQTIEMDGALDTGMECFLSIAKYHEIDVNANQIRHALAIEEKMEIYDIVKVAQEIKLKSKIAQITYEEIEKMVLPAIIQKQDNTFFMIAKADREKVLCLFPDKQAPVILQREEFEQLWNHKIVLFTKKYWKNADVKFGLKWFLPDIVKYKNQFLQVLVAALTIQILGIFTPMMIQVVIDKVLVHNAMNTLNVLAIALVVIGIFETIMSIAKNYVFTDTASKIDVLLSARLFKHLFSLPFRYFEIRRVGDTIARVRELETIRQFLTGAPLNTLLDTAFIIVYIIVMFFYSTTLTWIVISSMPLFVLLSAVVTPIFRTRLEERFNTGAHAQSYLVESVTGVQTIKAFALEPKIQRKWEDFQAEYIKCSFKTSVLAGNAGAIGQFIQKTFDILVLYFGAKLVIDNQLSVGQLIAFRMLSSRVSGPVLRLVQVWQEFQQTGISIERLGDIFNSKSEPSVDPSKVSLPEIKGEIRFEKVRFRYDVQSSEVIRDMSFTINPGEIVGIVGRSGSGKSTISKLIQRLYIPEMGKILIDGADISLVDPSWLRRQIGVVLQENFLFNATIKENISVHKPGASMEEIIEIAKIAGAHDFILEFPNGYNTMVGENGTGLSGGQKQRIAIARALLSNPRILIFDEATSALDYESESIIQQNLKKICQGRTVIIIAHRLSTIKDADEIMAIDKGQLVEFDTGANLLAQKGLYYYLHTQQEKGL